MERSDQLHVIPVDENVPLQLPQPSKRFGKRHVLLVIGFLGCANVYALRVNLSVALVAMTNSSFDDSNSKSNGHECQGLNGSSSPKVYIHK